MREHDREERRGLFGLGHRNAEDQPAEPPAQPIEVHEHIEVTEPGTGETVAERSVEPSVPPTAEPSGFHEERVRRFHEVVSERWNRTFTLTALLLFGLTIATVAWIFNDALRGEAMFGTLATDEVLMVGLVALVVGVALSWGAGEGSLAALVLGWIAGLGGMALFAMQYLQGFNALSLTSQALVGLVGVLGLAVLVSCSLAIASWRGRRVQARVIGGTGRMGGRVT